MKSKEMLAKATAMQAEYRLRMASGEPMTVSENLERANEMLALATEMNAESARITQGNTIIMVAFAAAAAMAAVAMSAIMILG